MDEIRELLSFLTDPQQFIRWGGYFALAAIVYTETGLMFGFFLPGDSLLVTAGLFAAKGDLDIVTLNLLLTTMAIAGDATGYTIGRKMGPRLFRMKDSRFFRRAHLIRTRLFYEKHGGATIIIARFMPIVRTFSALVAGVTGMPFRRYITFNVVGAVSWVFSMTMTGYLLGRVVPNLDKHIEILIIVVIGISFLPGVIGGWKERKEHSRLRAIFLADIRYLAAEIRVIDWSSSTETIREAIRHPAEARDGELAPDPATIEFQPAGDGKHAPRIELTAATSPDRAQLTDAGYDFTALDFEEKFKIAAATITESLGAPTTVVTSPDDEVTAHFGATHAAVWRHDNGRLILARVHDALRDRFRIAMVAEPVSAEPGATT